MVATLAKMAVPSYYIESQAAHEGYYTGGGKERPGEWHNPAGLFGLKNGGIVWEKKFYALCAGHSPDLDGTSLVQNAGSEKRSPGFDMTFSADKSISALWAITPRAEDREKIERAVIDAARCALDETVFQHCATTRVGKAGVDRRVETGDMLAATFLHRTSREGDPQLHVHATIFNAVKTHCDGKYRALHGYPLYSWKKAAGAAFRGHLAHIMQERLGIAMERHGPEGQYSRVREMDPELEQVWSKRRAAIVAAVAEHLGEEALSNPAQMAAATLATRSHKPEGGPTTEEDIERFLEEAAEVVDVEELRDRIHAAGIEELTRERIEEIHAEITAIPGKLAQMEAIFNVPNIIEKLENALAGAVDREAMGRWREVALGNAELVSLQYPEPGIEAQAGMAHKRIFTTGDTLRAEHTLRHVSALSVSDRTHAVEPGKVARLLEELASKGKRFSAEQRKAIDHAAAESGRIALIEGAAGSGKSHVLGPLADLWRAEGRTVRALAVAWSVAVELASDIDAPPSAVHPFLRKVNKGAVDIGPDNVLVVDEAGMLSTRQTLQLVRLSERTGCKLVLVGDTRQQQPIEAGPGMRIVRDRVKGVRIDRIRRQKATPEDFLREVDGLPAGEAMERAAAMTREDRAAARKRYTAMNRERKAAGEKPLRIERPWQLGVSALLRTGAMHQAFTELHKRGRLALAEGKEDALLRLVAHWSAYMAENPEHDAVVMARTRADVRALNALLRARHHAATGSPGHDPARDTAVIRIHRLRDRGKALEDDFEVRVGDRLRIGSTVSRLGLYNRDVVTVTGLEKRETEDGKTQVLITARTGDRRTIRFEPGDIRNWLGEITIDYAYAATCTAAQGLTIDAGFVLLDEGMARETAYPACTRHTDHLQVVADRLPVAIAIAGATPDGEPGREVSDDEVLMTLGRLCGRSQPKEAATDYILAANEQEYLAQGELELGRDPIEPAIPANDALEPGTAGSGPRRPGESPGLSVRRHADRAAVQRIIAASNRQLSQNANRAEAFALAADMEAVEAEWAGIAAQPSPAPDILPRVQDTLQRHKQVLHRVRVFLRSPAPSHSQEQHHKRVSRSGLEGFARLRRNMRNRWRESLREGEAAKARQAALHADTRRLSGALQRDWTDFRARAGQDFLALLSDPEHAGLVRRTAELAGSRTTDRQTARDAEYFLQGHLASFSAPLRQSWHDLQPADPDKAWTPKDVAAYRTVLGQSHALLSAMAAVPALRINREMLRQRLLGAPTYREALRSLVQALDSEEDLVQRREARMPGSSLHTRRLAAHIASLDAARRLPGLREEARKEIGRIIRDHRRARRDAGVTRNDGPWPTDEQIAKRLAANEQLRPAWQALREATRNDRLSALERPEHPQLVRLTARHAADPSLDPDTARIIRTYLVRHLQRIDKALDEAAGAIVPGLSQPRWTPAEFIQYRRLRTRARTLSRELAALPSELPLQGLVRDKWARWLASTPRTTRALDMLVHSLRAEDAAIVARETLLPRSTLPTGRLARHMASLAAATRLDGLAHDIRQELQDLRRLHVDARQAAGVSRDNAAWPSDAAARREAEGRALNRSWKEFRAATRSSYLAPLDHPDHGSLISRTATFAVTPGLAPRQAAAWRHHLERHLRELDDELDHARYAATSGAGRSGLSFHDFDTRIRLPGRMKAFAGILAGLPAGIDRPPFDLQAARRSLASAPSRSQFYQSFVDRLVAEERLLTRREAQIPGSTLATRRLASHMALLETLAAHDLVPEGDRNALQQLLDQHREARTAAGVSDTNLPWVDSPERQAALDCLRMVNACKAALDAADGGALIYQPGIEPLRPEIGHLLETGLLSAGDRSFLEKLQRRLDGEIRQRADILHTIDRARAHLEEYPPILERALAPKPPQPAPDKPPSPPGLVGRVRRLLGAEDGIPARPADPAPAPQALNDIDLAYRRWDLTAEQILKAFQSWSNNDSKLYLDHVDRRRIDISDVTAELEAIRSAAREPGAPPYQVEVPNAGRCGIEDQRHDPERLHAVLRRVLDPDRRPDPKALLELARRNRAWPKETLTVFRACLDQAADTDETLLHTRLAASLPANLADSFRNLSAETWRRHAEVRLRHRTLTRDQGLSL